MDCTCGYSQKRGTLDLIEAEDIREIFDEIESSPVMETLWKTYQKNYSYAADYFMACNCEVNLCIIWKYIGEYV